MRQTLDRWRSGFRARATDAWWSIREARSLGPRGANLGRALGLALVVIVAFDVVLLVRALRVEPVASVPTGLLPSDTMSISEEDAFTDSLGAPSSDPALAPPAGQGDDDASSDATEAREKERNASERSAAAEGAEVATGAEAGVTAGTPGDTTSASGDTGGDTGDTAGTGDTGDTGADTGPGGSGPGGSGSGGSDGSGTTGGGGGGG